MPDVLTRYLFENPYPLGIVLAVVALVLLWIGLREGRRDRLMPGLAALALAAGVFIADAVVKTPGERAREVVRAFVGHVSAGDLALAIALVTDSATLHWGDRANPGQSLETIEKQLSRVVNQAGLERVDITQLRATSDERDRATTNFGTMTRANMYSGPSTWEVEVVDDDGTWRIQRFVCVTIMGRPAQRP